MTIKITTPNGGSDSLDFGCAQTPVVATVTGTEVSSGEGKLELKTTTGGTSATKATVLANGNVGIGTTAPAQKLTTVGTASAGVLTPSLMVANSLTSNDSVAGMCFHTRYDVNGTGFKAAIVLDGDNNSDATGDLKFLNSNEANIANPATIASHTRLVITKAGDLKFNSGYGSAATAYGCRAWVNFNGSGTVSINASGNVSSITDNGTGNYTVNFTVAMPDANFAVSGLAKSADTGGIRGAFMSLVANSTATATGYVRVTTQYENVNVRDSNPVTVAIFR